MRQHPPERLPPPTANDNLGAPSLAAAPAGLLETAALAQAGLLWGLPHPAAAAGVLPPQPPLLPHHPAFYFPNHMAAQGPAGSSLPGWPGAPLLHPGNLAYGGSGHLAAASFYGSGQPEPAWMPGGGPAAAYVRPAAAPAGHGQPALAFMPVAEAGGGRSSPDAEPGTDSSEEPAQGDGGEAAVCQPPRREAPARPSPPRQGAAPGRRASPGAAAAAAGGAAVQPGPAAHRPSPTRQAPLAAAAAAAGAAAAAAASSGAALPAQMQAHLQPAYAAQAGQHGTAAAVAARLLGIDELVPGMAAAPAAGDKAARRALAAAEQMPGAAEPLQLTSAGASTATALPAPGSWQQPGPCQNPPAQRTRCAPLPKLLPRFCLSSPSSFLCRRPGVGGACVGGRSVRP